MTVGVDCNMNNDYMIKHITERRIACVNRKNIICDASSAFMEYFGNAKTRNLLDFLDDDSTKIVEKLIADYCGKQSSIIVKAKYCDGTYRYNVLRTFEESITVGEGYIIHLELIDVENSVNNNIALIDDIGKLHLLLGITDEYSFCYNKKTNVIEIYRYEQFERMELYSMDIDEWKTYILDNKFVADEDIDNFKVLIYDIKEYSQNISINIKTSLRTKTDIRENLRFCGTIYNYYGNDKVVIGRILPADCANRQQAIRIVDELQYDSLTHVYNKKSITSYARNIIKNVNDNNVAIVILDIDHFKQVNDTYGHMYGDQVLAKVGARLKSIVGAEGMVGRIGGDEFLIILNGINDSNMLRTKLRTIRLQIKWEFSLDFDNFMITCSMGASICPNNGTDYNELFNKADYCLYVAKEKGRDRYVFFVDDLHRERYEQSILNNRMYFSSGRRELSEFQFVREYQLQLLKDSKTAIRFASDHILLNYKVDGINVYYGDDLKKIRTFGYDQDNYDDLSYVHTKGFNNIFNGNNYIVVGMIQQVEENAPEYYEYLKNKGIFSTLVCYIRNENKVVGMVTFNKYKDTSQWSDFEIDSCVIVGSTMLQHYDIL